MTLVTLPQFGFVKGILDEVMNNRNEIDIFRYGASELSNYNILPQGPIQKRRGFKHIDSATGVKKLIPFYFSDVQEYLLAVKDQQIDIYTADDNTYRASIATPFLEAEIDSIKWTQSFDTMILCHENHPPQELTRSSNTVWNITDLIFEDPPVDRFNVSATLTPSGTTGSITLTLDENYWDAGHVGVLIRTNEGAAIIDSISSPTVANATTTENLVNTNADSAWREEVGSSVHGYYRVPVFHANRLIFCGSRDLPQSLWASKTGDIDNFNAENLDDDTGFAGTLSSGFAEPIYDAIVHGSGTDANLQIYTASSEWVLEGQPLTPSSANPKVQTRIGSRPRPRPIEINSQVLFASNDGKSVYDFTYEFASNSFKNSNLTMLAPSVVVNPVDLAYLRNYKTTQADFFYVLNSTGQLSMLTINKQREVLGWSSYTTDGTITSMCVSDNKLRLVVERDNGTYLEEMTEDDVYMDCYTQLTDTAATSWGPVAHLADQTVTALVDGFPETITLDGSGNFTTTSAADSVDIGYNYTSQFTSMPLVFQVQGKEMRGESIRKVKIVINTLDTKDLIVDGYRVPIRRFGNKLLDEPLPVLTEPVTVRLKGRGGEPKYTISSTLPLPQTVIGSNITLRAG